MPGNLDCDLYYLTDQLVTDGREFPYWLPDLALEVRTRDAAAATAVGDLGSGVATSGGDVARSGYVMWSSESIHTRFTAPAPNGNQADHFIAVFHDGTDWRYDNNGAAAGTVFTPVKSDHLIAEIEWSAPPGIVINSITTITEYAVIEGIRAGVSSTDLVFTPNVWNGNANDDEFGITGSTFTAATGVFQTSLDVSHAVRSDEKAAQIPSGSSHYVHNTAGLTGPASLTGLQIIELMFRFDETWGSSTYSLAGANGGLIWDIGYRFDTRTFEFRGNTDGTSAGRTFFVSDQLPISVGTGEWFELRVEYDPTAGEVEFYYRAEDAGAWIKIGSTITGTTGQYANTTLTVGMAKSTNSFGTGAISMARLYWENDGTPVCLFDPYAESVSPAAVLFTDTDGVEWSMIGSAAIVETQRWEFFNPGTNAHTYDAHFEYEPSNANATPDDPGHGEIYRDIHSDQAGIAADTLRLRGWAFDGVEWVQTGLIVCDTVNNAIGPTSTIDNRSDGAVFNPGTQYRIEGTSVDTIEGLADDNMSPPLVAIQRADGKNWTPNGWVDQVPVILCAGRPLNVEDFYTSESFPTPTPEDPTWIECDFYLQADPANWWNWSSRSLLSGRSGAHWDLILESDGTIGFTPNENASAAGRASFESSVPMPGDLTDPTVLHKLRVIHSYNGGSPSVNFYYDDGSGYVKFGTTQTTWANSGDGSIDDGSAQGMTYLRPAEATTSVHPAPIMLARAAWLYDGVTIAELDAADGIGSPASFVGSVDGLTYSKVGAPEIAMGPFVRADWTSDLTEHSSTATWATPYFETDRPDLAITPKLFVQDRIGGSSTPSSNPQHTYTVTPAIEITEPSDGQMAAPNPMNVFGDRWIGDKTELRLERVDGKVWDGREFVDDHYAIRPDRGFAAVAKVDTRRINHFTGERVAHRFEIDMTMLKSPNVGSTQYIGAILGLPTSVGNSASVDRFYLSSASEAKLSHGPVIGTASTNAWGTHGGSSFPDWVVGKRITLAVELDTDLIEAGNPRRYFYRLEEDGDPNAWVELGDGTFSASHLLTASKNGDGERPYLFANVIDSVDYVLAQWGNLYAGYTADFQYFRDPGDGLFHGGRLYDYNGDLIAAIDVDKDVPYDYEMDRPTLSASQQGAADGFDIDATEGRFYLWNETGYQSEIVRTRDQYLQRAIDDGQGGWDWTTPADLEEMEHTIAYRTRLNDGTYTEWSTISFTPYALATLPDDRHLRRGRIRYLWADELEDPSNPTVFEIAHATDLTCDVADAAGFGARNYDSIEFATVTSPDGFGRVSVRPPGRLTLTMYDRDNDRSPYRPVLNRPGAHGYLVCLPFGDAGVGTPAEVFPVQLAGADRNVGFSDGQAATFDVGMTETAKRIETRVA